MFHEGELWQDFQTGTNKEQYLVLLLHNAEGGCVHVLQQEPVPFAFPTLKSRAWRVGGEVSLCMREGGTLEQCRLMAES